MRSWSGKHRIKHLPSNIFTTPEYTIEASNYFNVYPDGSETAKDPLNAGNCG